MSVLFSFLRNLDDSLTHRNLYIYKYKEVLFV